MHLRIEAALVVVQIVFAERFDDLAPIDRLRVASAPGAETSFALFIPFSNEKF